MLNPPFALSAGRDAGLGGETMGEPLILALDEGTTSTRAIPEDYPRRSGLQTVAPR